MSDNPRRAARECREHVREQFSKREALFDALDDYLGGREGNLDKAEAWVSTYLSKEWRRRKEAEAQKIKEDAYNIRRNGIMRLRRMPVSSPERAEWYETGDGRIDALDKKGKISLHSKYVLSLGAKPPKRRFTY